MATGYTGNDAALQELKKRMQNADEITVNCRNERKHREEVADAIKELKKRTKKSGIMQELRRREEFVAPSKKRRLKREASRKQRRRDDRRNERARNEEF